MRICKHLNDLQNTGVDLETHDCSIHGVLIQGTNETVDLCDDCLADTVITNQFEQSYSTWSAIKESEDWGLVGEKEIFEATPRMITKTVYYQVTEAEVTHSWEVTGTSDEDILKKAKDINIDIYLHEPNRGENSHLNKEDAGCDSCKIEVAFDKADLNKSSNKDEIIKALVSRLYDVCPDDEELTLNGKTITHMEKLQSEYLPPRVYIHESSLIKHQYQVRFSGTKVKGEDQVLGELYCWKDAQKFYNLKEDEFLRTGVV